MTLIWGVNYVAVKIGLRYFPPLLFGTVRLELVALALFPFALRVKRGDWGSMAVAGVAGLALNQIAFVYGMQNTSVAHASFLFMTMPLQALVLSALRGHEHLTMRKVVGMAIAAAGVAWLQFSRTSAGGTATLFGDAMMVLAAFFFALFVVISKETIREYGGVTVTAAAHAASAVVLLPVTVLAGRTMNWSAVPAAGWLTMLYMVLFPSILAYLIFYYALRRAPASRVTSFTYLQPLIAATTALWILNEPLTTSVFAGGALILGGVFVVQRAS